VNVRDVGDGVGQTKTERARDRWLRDDYSWRQRLWRASKGLYYNKLPERYRPISILHWTFKTAITSSGPAVALYYGTINAAAAAVVTGALFIGHAIISILERTSKAREASQDDNHTESMVRFGDLLTAYKVNSVARENIDAAITACLGIVEVFSRDITKSKKGDIAVSLVLYKGSSATQMKIRHRNPGNTRPINREFDGNNYFGHHVCQSGSAPRVVHDIEEFGGDAAKSPTQSMLNYRSIFFIPIVDKDDPTKVRGFMSIDSKRPYAFFGNRSNVIVVTCEPVVSRLKQMI
jgi:hypothetical protein